MNVDESASISGPVENGGDRDVLNELVDADKGLLKATIAIEVLC